MKSGCGLERKRERERTGAVGDKVGANYTSYDYLTIPYKLSDVR